MRSELIRSPSARSLPDSTLASVRRFLGTLVVLQLLVGAGALAAPTVDEWLQGRIDPALEGTTRVETPREVRTETVLRPGQAAVTGVVTRLVAERALAPALTTPLTIEAGERGVTRAVINGAEVSGQQATISWDGGRPLPITGTGGLRLGATRLTVDAAGMAWALEGEPRGFVPGSYRCNFTVGVAREGIASVREGVVFTATEATVLQVTRGTAFVRRPAGPVTVEAGEDATALLEGELTVRTSDDERSAGAVQFGPGLYRITLTPVPGGYQVDALLQGPVEL